MNLQSAAFRMCLFFVLLLIEPVGCSCRPPASVEPPHDELHCLVVFNSCQIQSGVKREHLVHTEKSFTSSLCSPCDGKIDKRRWLRRWWAASRAVVALAVASPFLIFSLHPQPLPDQTAYTRPVVLLSKIKGNWF